MQWETRISAGSPQYLPPLPAPGTCAPPPSKEIKDSRLIYILSIFLK